MFSMFMAGFTIMWAACVLYLLFSNNTNRGAGSRYDVTFENLHILQKVPQRIPLLCMSPSQVHNEIVDIAKERKTQGFTCKQMIDVLVTSTSCIIR